VGYTHLDWLQIEEMRRKLKSVIYEMGSVELVGEITY
jgi:hypothetical protein